MNLITFFHYYICNWITFANILLSILVSMFMRDIGCLFPLIGMSYEILIQSFYWSCKICLKIFPLLTVLRSFHAKLVLFLSYIFETSLQKHLRLQFSLSKGY